MDELLENLDTAINAYISFLLKGNSQPGFYPTAVYLRAEIGDCIMALHFEQVDIVKLIREHSEQ